MSLIKLENGYTYYTDVLEALETAEGLGNSAKERAPRGTKISAESATLLGMRRWKMSCFAFEYRLRYEKQQQEIHGKTLNFIAEGIRYEICICGLAVEMSENLDDFLSRSGHIRVSDRSLQSLFVIIKLGQTTQDSEQYSFYCQTCGDLEGTPFTGNRAESLAELRKSHFCSGAGENIEGK